MPILDANGSTVAQPIVHVEFHPGPSQPTAMMMPWPDGRPGAYCRIIGGMTVLQEIAGRIVAHALEGIDPAAVSDDWIEEAGNAAAKLAAATLKAAERIELADIKQRQEAAQEAARQQAENAQGSRPETHERRNGSRIAQ
jgi:ABC-type nitrate/sulfonate/bicarbonate transport system substrate-binding protein